jgi:hypothetical protein
MTSLPKASDKRVVINGKSRVVYIGARGGEYILQKKVFVSVKNAINSAEKSKQVKAKKISKNRKMKGGGIYLDSKCNKRRFFKVYKNG